MLLRGTRSKHTWHKSKNHPIPLSLLTPLENKMKMKSLDIIQVTLPDGFGELVGGSTPIFKH